MISLSTLVRRGGRRRNAGRPAQHAVAERLHCLDVRDLHRVGILDPQWLGEWQTTAARLGRERSLPLAVRADTMSLQLRRWVGDLPLDQRVGLARTPCNYGGERTWFLCPMCERRVAVLFLRGDYFLCRYCHRVAYRSQSRDQCDRAWIKQRVIERQLDELWMRPRGMHETTHQRLLHKIWLCQMARAEWLFKRVGRLTPEFQRLFRSIRKVPDLRSPRWPS
jgi:hypothetical protein